MLFLFLGATVTNVIVARRQGLPGQSSLHFPGSCGAKMDFSNLNPLQTEVLFSTWRAAAEAGFQERIQT